MELNMKFQPAYLLSFMALVFVGCATDGGGTNNGIELTNKTIEKIDDNIAKKAPTEVFTYYPNGAQMMAIVYGKFVLKNNCLLLEPIGQDKLLTPVFPKGEIEFLINEGVVVIKGVRVPLGKQFGTGGGALPNKNVTYATKGDPTCLMDTVFISDGDIIAIEDNLDY